MLDVYVVQGGGGKMSDIWIQMEEEQELKWKQALIERKKKEIKREKKAETTPCDNCGQTPAYQQNYSGIYKPAIFPNGFNKNLCKKCNARFDEWYYPEDMQDDK